MEKEEVIENLKKLPDPHRTRALEAYSKFPAKSYHHSGTDNKIAEAIFNIRYSFPEDYNFWRDLYLRAVKGEFDSVESNEYSVAMITISVEEYETLSKKAKRFDQIQELTWEP